MFRFLRFGRSKEEPKVETQRELFERTVAELNAGIDSLSEKPAVTVEPGTGHVTLALPEQFPDEALPLPAPDADAPATPADAGRDATTEGEETPETDTTKAG